MFLDKWRVAKLLKQWKISCETSSVLVPPIFKNLNANNSPFVLLAANSSLLGGGGGESLFNAVFVLKKCKYILNKSSV